MKSGITKRIGQSAMICTLAICAAAPQVASAALETRSWIGNTDNRWNTNANWNPTSAPLASDRIAVFDSAANFQPAIQTHVTVIGGIWMTGDTVNSMEITSDPLGQNNGAPTFQTNGNTINSIAGVGILMDNASSGALTINTSAFKVGGTQAWINNSANLFTLAAPTNFNGTTVTVKGSGDTLISGSITNSTGTGALAKDDTGTLTLSNPTNSYNGATTISNGTLLVNGALSSSTALVTANGGTIGGTGTIGRATTINSGAILAPGASSATAGMLTIDRSLTLGGTTSFDLISPSSNDSVRFNSGNSTSYTLTFGGELEVKAPGVAFAAGQTYDLFDWGTGSKFGATTFSSFDLPVLPSGLSWEMYDGQPFNYATGAISVVPEPVSASVFSFAAAGLLLIRRRRGANG